MDSLVNEDECLNSVSEQQIKIVVKRLLDEAIQMDQGSCPDLNLATGEIHSLIWIAKGLRGTIWGKRNVPAQVSFLGELREALARCLGKKPGLVAESLYRAKAALCVLLAKAPTPDKTLAV